MVNKALEETEAERDAAREAERQLFSEGAVLASQAEEAAAREKEVSDRLGGLCCKVPVLILEDIGKMLRRKTPANGKYTEDERLERGAQFLEQEAEEISKCLDESFGIQKDLLLEEEELKSFLEGYAIEKRS